MSRDKRARTRAIIPLAERVQHALGPLAIRLRRQFEDDPAAQAASGRAFVLSTPTRGPIKIAGFVKHQSR